jgi:hypothetical protein
MDHELKKGKKQSGDVQLEKLLRASELSHRRLFEAAKDGILILENRTRDEPWRILCDFAWTTIEKRKNGPDA